MTLLKKTNLEKSHLKILNELYIIETLTKLIASSEPVLLRLFIVGYYC